VPAMQDDAKQLVRTQVWNALDAAGAVYDDTAHGRITSADRRKPPPGWLNWSAGRRPESSRPCRTRPSCRYKHAPWMRASSSTWPCRNWPPPSRSTCSIPPSWTCRRSRQRAAR
jgi:hypothetical protein